MSDIKLFKRGEKALVELEGIASPLEKSLQNLFEKNLEILLGVRFLASEYVTTNGGRMDTLGIDENGFPVIIEYKRHRSDNIINQGLFYLDWLMDHRGAYELLVRDKLGKDAADKIEWSAPRLVCIAGDFNKFDTHAVKQMGRNIELIRYRGFGEDLLLLELLTSVSAKPTASTSPNATSPKTKKTNLDHLKEASSVLQDIFEALSTFALDLGDDVTRKETQLYTAFRRIKNFACVEVRPQTGVLRMYLKVNPDQVDLIEGFSRDVRDIGTWGTGDLELNIRDVADFERAKPLIIRSYEAS